MNANPTAVRLFTVLAVTVGLFVVYFLFLTPLLESPLPKKIRNNTEIAKKNEVFHSPYARFFDADAWECTTEAGNLLKSGNLVMFFQNFAIDESMKIRSNKCTILLAPGKSTFPEQEIPGKPFHPVIISMEEGVELQLSSQEGSSTPRLLGGKLIGPVTVNYKVQVQGHWMDCFLTTSDLICDMTSVQTQKPVLFMLGPLSGEGNQFKLIFKSSGEKEDFSGIQSIQLSHLKEIRLKLTPFLIQQLNLNLSPKMQAQIEKMFGGKLEIPVILTCDGPMVYDVASGKVTFNQNVQLVCKYPVEPMDSLTCDELTLRLPADLQDRLAIHSEETSEKIPNEPIPSNGKQVSQNSSDATFTQESSMQEIPVESILAKQNVKLNIPTFECSAETESLEFHVPNQTLELSGKQQSAIYFQKYEFHANQLSYILPPQKTKQYGTFQVSGNGWFRTFLPKNENSEKEEPLTLSWHQGFLAETLEDLKYNAKITGKVVLESPIFGSLTADEIHAVFRPKTNQDLQNEWNVAVALKEPIHSGIQANSGSQTNLIPEFLQASGHVQLQAEQQTARLSAELQEIKLDFSPAIKVPDSLIVTRKLEQEQSKKSSESVFPQNLGHQNLPTENTPTRDFKLNAERFSGKIQLLPGKEAFYIETLQLEGTETQPLHLREQTPFQNSEQVIVVQAQKIVLHDLYPQTLQCEIQGNPASLAGFGVRLESPKIAVNCAANRIDINNAGKMHIFHRKKAPTLNYSTLTELIFSWGKNLVFDGKVITVQDDVQLHAPSSALTADKISALLSEPITLYAPPRINSKNQQQMLEFFADVSAEQNVRLKHQNFNEEKQLIDVFTVESNFASFKPESMQLSILGKGTLRLSHFGTIGSQEETLNRNPSETNRNPAVTQTTAPSSPSKPEWFQILLEYYGGIEGNLNDGVFTINDRISALAFPVPNEKYLIPQTRIEPRKIPEKGFQFLCDQIFLNQVPSFQNSSWKTVPEEELQIEMQAKGNVRMENSMFSVTGNELKYSQEKNICTIIGTPSRPVTAFHQEIFGGRRDKMEAKNIEINLKTMKFNLDQVMLEGAY